MVRSFVFMLIMGTIISLAAAAYVIYITIESNRSGDWKLLMIRVTYLIIVVVGLVGITLTIKYVIKIQQNIKEISVFQITEGNFFGSNESLISTVDESERFIYKTEYTYIYEYFANGKRYEYLHKETKYPLKEPKKDSLKKITLRYNPEKPEEVMWLKHDTRSLITGIILIGISILLFLIIKGVNR